MFYANVEMNEILYQEADINAAQYAIIQSFASVVRATSSALYGEADNAASQGILSKVANFFKNLGNKVIEFIKKLVNVTLSLLLKPFGAKVAIGSAGKSSDGGGSSGGGGSSSSGGESTENTSKIAPKSGNMKEIANILKTISAYLKSDTPSDVSYKSVMNNNNPFTRSDKGTYTLINSDSSKGAIQASMNTVKTLVGDIESTLANFKTYNNKLNKSDEIINVKSSENLLATAVSGINSSKEKMAIKTMATANANGEEIIPKSHPSLSVAFNVVDSKKVEEFGKHAHSLAYLMNLIEDVLEYSKIVSETSEIIIKRDITEYSKSTFAYGNSVMKWTISEKGKPEKKGIEGDIYNLFGVPSSVALLGSRFFVVRSLEQSLFEQFIPKSSIEEFGNKCPVLKDYLGPNYRNTLVSNKGYNFDAIDKTLKSVSLSGGANLNTFINDVNSGTSTLIQSAMLKIQAALYNYKNLDARLNKADDDGVTQADKKANRAEKVESELAKKGNSAAALREFLGGSAKIIKNMGNVTSESTAAIRELWYELEASTYAVGVVIMANTIMYKRDYIHYACKAINELLNDEKYRKKEFKKEDEVNKIREDVKKALADLTKLSKAYKF